MDRTTPANQPSETAHTKGLNTSESSIKRLGHFTIQAEIGRGGMGVVYRAYDEHLGRVVALKVLPARARSSREASMRFQIEARATARLNHEHVVPVYAVDEDQGIPYYAMKLISGTNLSQVLRITRKSLASPTQDEARKSTVPAPNKSTKPDSSSSDFSGKVFCQSHLETGAKVSAHLIRAIALLGSNVARALEHAHENEIIHRDIKPSNLLLDEDNRVWLSDFGLARIESGGSITRTGALLGTYRYMSPEQALGKRAYVDHRTDIYSLGATLYELATLEPMCPGESQVEVLEQLHFGSPVPLRKLNPNITKDFDIVISKATERSPKDRYESAAAMAEDLLKVAQGKPIATRKVSSLKRGIDWVVSRPRLASGVVTGTLALILLMSLTLAIVADQRSKTSKALRRMTIARCIAEMALNVVKNPGGAIGIGVAAPDLDQNVEGQHILMQALDGNHELKTVQLRQKYPGQLAWNPDLDLMLVCTDHRYYGTEARAHFVDTNLREIVAEFDSNSTVTSAAFSPVGSLFLTTGTSFGPHASPKFNEAKFSSPTLWNAKTRKQERVFADARLATCDPACFSKDGRWIVLPLRSGGARMYRLRGDVESILLQPKGAEASSNVMGAVFSPDQRFVATWADDGHVAIFDVASRKAVKEFEVNVRRDSSFVVSFAPDSAWLLARSMGGTMLFDVSNWQKPHIYRTDTRSCFVGSKHDVALVSRKTARLYNPDFDLVTEQVDLPEFVAGISALGLSNKLVAQRQDVAFVIDFVTGRVSAQLRGHTDHIVDVAAPAYADSIATVGWDQTLRFWDEKSDRLRRELDIDLVPSAPPVVGYSDNGKYAVLGTVQQDLTCTFFNSSPQDRGNVAGRIQLRLEDGSYLTSEKGKLRLYDAESPKQLRSVDFRELITEVEEVQKTGVVVTTISGKVFHWDLKSPLPTKLNPSGEYMRVVPIPGATQVVAAMGEKLLLLDLLQATKSEIYSGLKSKAYDIAVSPDGTRAAVLAADMKLLVLNLRSSEPDGETILSFAANGVDFAEDGEKVLVYQAGLGKKVAVLDRASLNILTELSFARIRNVSSSGDGKSCAIATSEGLYLWKLSEEQPDKLGEYNCLFTEFVGQDLHVLARPVADKAQPRPNGNSEWLRLDQQTGEVLSQQVLPFQAIDLHANAGGNGILVGGRSSGVEIVEMDSMRAVRSVHGHNSEMVVADFSADGSKVITVARTGNIKSSLINGESDELIGQHGGNIASAALSPDRNVLIISEDTGRLTEWDLAAYKVDNEYVADGKARQIVFGNDNIRFASVHDDGKVALWDRGLSQNTPKQIFEFEQGVKSVSLSPDAKNLLCVFGVPDVFVSSSGFFGEAQSDGGLQARAVLIDLASAKQTAIQWTRDFAEGAFYSSGDHVGLLCFDGSLQVYDVDDISAGPQEVAAPGEVQRLIKVGASSPMIYAIAEDSVKGWNCESGLQQYEVSGVVTKPFIQRDFDNWKLQAEVERPLLLLGDRRAIVYPRSPLDYAEQTAPRGLTEKELAELSLGSQNLLD